MKQFIKKLFHRHNWQRYKAIPEYVISHVGGQIQGDNGTAVFSKCVCGRKRKEEYWQKYKLVEGFLVSDL